MKKIAFLSIIVVILAGAIITSCNQKRQGPEIKPAHVLLFSVKQFISPEESNLVSEKISLIKGIAACSINLSQQTISVMYLTDEISETELPKIIEEKTALQLEKHEFKAGGKECPVHSPSAFWNYLFN